MNMDNRAVNALDGQARKPSITSLAQNRHFTDNSELRTMDMAIHVQQQTTTLLMEAS